ncbi:DUF5305 family protein [Halobellus ordinarius]|uniref:DUF5305 family protein n=1 Tax=Halobellus ordinarius TaxID=3075120 RepID=UPI002880AE45|nr:DUF5305 family protein [Halobellus sp. ZY16]
MIKQIELAVGRYGRFIALGMAILGLVALGGAGQTYLNPPVEEVTENTNTQTIQTTTETSAVVENSTPLYDEGQVLRDMPIYFFEASPELTLRIRTDVPGGQQVQVSQRHVIQLRATRDGQTFYEDQRVVAADQTRVSDGTVWVNTTMNMQDVRSYVSEKQSAVSGAGSLQVTLRQSVTYETNDYAGTLNTSAPLALSGETYWIDGDLSASRTHSTPVTRRSVGSPDMTMVGGLGALGIGLLAGAVAVIRRSREIDPLSVETDLARSRYDEWISNGEIPTKSDKEYIRTDSLEDLVDIAIDSNGRVIYDRSLDAYAVVQGDLVYYFITDETALTEWFDV